MVHMQRREFITFSGAAAAVRKRAKRQTALLHEAGYLLLGLVSLATVTGLYFWLDVPLVAAAFTYLVVLVLLSLVSNLSSLIVLSFIGVGCLSYFFAPPIYSFRVDYPQDLITISAFMITSFVVNFLVTRVQAEQHDHMRALEALRESERSSRSAIDGIAGLVAIMAPNGELDALNRQGIEYFGRSLEEMKTWGTSDAVHPEDLPRIAEIFKRSLVTGTPFHYELRLRRFDGEYRWFDNRGVPTREKSGRMVRWYILGTEIEDRKRAEEALRESEAKFRDYAETASDWLWEIGPDYKFTLLSENAFGSGAADRIGTACWDHALDFETEPEKWRLVWETLDGRKPFRDFVYRGLSGNGSPMYVRASGKPVFDTNGKFRGYRGTGTDVTALMRAQEALRESERSSRSAIDGIAGLLAIMAPNGELETVNRQCLEYFGRSLEWLANWGTNDAVHPEDLPRVLELFKRAMASGIPYHFDQRLRRFDGEYRWFDNRGVPIRDDSGRIARWYVLLTDIEDRTQALARLDQMQSDFAHMNRVATMGQLTASITHEVNQPITAAVTYALAARRFLSADPPNFREVEDALSLIVKAGNRAGEVVQRIRALIKKVPARKDAVAIDDAVLEVIALTRTEAANNSVSVRTQFAEGLPRVKGDRVQLQQVMLNLIVNAIQAMSGIGEGARELQISIDAVPSEGGVRVGVRDTGPGLSPESLSRLFEPFYTTKPEGMGMGLSICRSIIEAHGGRLWATRCEPQGAHFQFTIPAT
jgi:PAS domain S-box-containing protein